MFDIDSRSIFLHEHDAVGRFENIPAGCPYSAVKNCFHEIRLRGTLLTKDIKQPWEVACA